jgi:hypothetical protein
VSPSPLPPPDLPLLDQMKLHEDVTHENIITQKRLREKLSYVLDELNLYKKRVVEQEIHLDNMNSLIQAAGIDVNFDDEEEEEEGEDEGEESYYDSYDDEEIPPAPAAAHKTAGSGSGSSRRHSQAGTYIPFTPPMNSIRKVFQHVTDDHSIPSSFPSPSASEDHQEEEEYLHRHRHHQGRDRDEEEECDSFTSSPPSSSSHLKHHHHPSSTQVTSSSSKLLLSKSPPKPSSSSSVHLSSLAPLRHTLQSILSINQTKSILFKNSFQSTTLLLHSLLLDTSSSLTLLSLHSHNLTSKYFLLTQKYSTLTSKYQSSNEVKRFLQHEITEFYEKEFQFQTEKFEFQNLFRQTENEKNEILIKKMNLKICYEELEEENSSNKLRYQKLFEEVLEMREELRRVVEEKEMLLKEMERKENENVEMMNEKDLLEQCVEVMRCERDELVKQFIPGGYYERDEYGIEILYTR